ncbi:hypothetical protein [Gaoshiqia sediminis]|uniref:Lipoprotein n=1 Tax=Gaoshiqia sediminis TaxID=2986998 RepID=A0AA41YE95_9BACT|nr:hypothetical protein [Gaoshiqia sediminis]MCW0484107.1 hypothetical protein [Gaoshiqia sediminis]
MQTIMKRIFILIFLLAGIGSCSKDDKKDFVLNEPITEWNLTKEQVKALETHSLLKEDDFELQYSADGEISKIMYLFDEIPGEVWLGRSDLQLVHNKEVFDDVFSALKRLYGMNYNESHYDDGDNYYSWEVGDTYVELYYGNIRHELKYYRITHQ